MTAHPPPPAPGQPYPPLQPMQPTYGTMPPPPPAPGPQRYGRIVAIVLAPFFSRGLYRDVARNWRGIGALYLLLLLAVTWAAVMVKLHISVTTSARDEFPKFANDIPPITMKDGVVSSPVDQPYEIKDKDTGRVLAVLDTTGTVNSLDDTPAQVLLTQNKLHYRKSNRNQTETTDLSQVKSFYLDRERVVSWVNTGAKWLAPGLYIPAVLGSLAFRLVQALIYGAIGLALASMFDVRLSFAAAMRLAVIAVTPVILLDTIFSLTGIDIPFWTLLGIVIALVYLAIAVKANHDPAAPPAQPYPYAQPPAQTPPVQPPPAGRPTF